MSFGDVSQYSRTSGFDEEHVDPHGECAAEIHRLQAENAARKAEVAEARAKAIPEDFTTHQAAWRTAIEGMIKLAEKSPSFDEDGADISYWKHELRVFDAAYRSISASQGEQER